MSNPVPRIAVLGAGHWGKNLIRNFAELGGLAAVVDPDVATASALVAAHGGAVMEFDAVLADPTIVGVAIAAPAPLHHSLARRALDAGKHVYVEKPISHTINEGRAMVNAAGDIVATSSDVAVNTASSGASARQRHSQPNSSA